MNSQPLVTIGAINYNNSKYVIETLDSINAQTYSNIELIIVDDCSTDCSPSLIEEWVKTFDKPFKFIRHPKNLGVCATCNDVLKNATGKYISIIATDDIMMPEKLGIQVEILEKSSEKVCAVYSDAFLIQEDSSPRYGWFIQRYKDFIELPSGDIYKTLLERNFLPAMSVLVKKSCYDTVGFFDEQLAFEDYDMWLRLSKSFEFLYSDYVSVKYRVRSNSLSFVINNWNLSYSKLFLKHIPNELAVAQLEKLAMDAYIYKDRKYLEIIKGHTSTSKIIKKIYLLSQLKVPSVIGKRIMKNSYELVQSYFK